jgi:phosphatidylglycerol:prolipoprotein diacylglycerol transferase
MLWVGMMLGLYRTVKAAKGTKIKAESVVDVVLYGVISGIVCAHLASVLLDLPLYLKNPSEIFGLWQGMFSPEGGVRGLSFHGGLIGAIGAAYIYTRIKRIDFLSMLDLCAPGLSIAYGITRIGCFLNGCCFGVPASVPWAVRFHVDGGAGMTPPSHPTQLYATAASFLIFWLLTLVEKRRRFTGEVFTSYLALYSIYRFLNEFLRKGVTADVAFAGLTQAQVVSLVVLVASLVVLWVNRRRVGAKR